MALCLFDRHRGIGAPVAINVFHESVWSGDPDELRKCIEKLLKELSVRLTREQDGALSSRCFGHHRVVSPFTSPIPDDEEALLFAPQNVLGASKHLADSLSSDHGSILEASRESID